MGKKIFKISAIVIGVVVAFVGAVAGVLALMGKFNVPDLKPEVLVFEDNGKVILPFNADYYNNVLKSDSDKAEYRASMQSYYDFDKEMYYFVLTGTNSNEEFPVNIKECYIWFHENEGVDLITLYDSKGAPITSVQNQYLVNCNEKIYFKLNELDENSYLDGKFMIRASREDKEVYVSENLTWYIDREIEEISLQDNTDVYIDNIFDEMKQNIEIGLDTEFEIGYKVSPSYAKKPLSNQNAKDIELYYLGNSVDGYNDQYIKITKETLINDDSVLSKIMYYDEDRLLFKANADAMIARYYFQIATFPTYRARDAYILAGGDSLSLEDKLSQMLTTELTIDVVPTDISEVSMRDETISLNLYKTKSLAINSTGDNGEYVNLGITMKLNDKETTIRYSEIAMNTLLNYESNKEPTFIAENGTEEKKWEDIHTGVIEYSNVELSIGKIIRYITVTEGDAPVTYYCNNGIAVENGTGVILLKSGSYLDFYTKSGDDYTLANISEYFEIGNRIADPNYNYANNHWDIKVKKELDEDIYLGVLVVNGNGMTDFSKFFKAVEVKTQEENLTYEINSEISDELLISYGVGGDQVVYDEINIEDLIQVKTGSYDRVVLFTTDRELVDTINIRMEGDSNRYLVGYIDDNGKFVNAIRAKSQYRSVNLDLVQLDMTYDDLLLGKTATDIIQEIIKDKALEDNNLVEPLELTNEQIKGIKYSTAFEFKPHIKPVIHQDADVNSLFDIKLYKGVNETNKIYAAGNDYKLVITDITNGKLLTNMIWYNALLQDPITGKVNSNIIRVSNYPGLVETVREVNANGDIPFLNVTGLTINFSALQEADDVGVYLTGCGKELCLKEFDVLSSTPTNMKYVYDNDSTKFVQLAKLGEAEAPKLIIDYSVDGNSYNYSYSIQGINWAAPISGISSPVFNSQLQNVNNAIGFYDQDEFKEIEHTIQYESTNTNVISFNIYDLNINSIGEAQILVKVGGATFYMNVEVRANTTDKTKGYFTLDYKNGKERIVTADNFYLNNNVSPLSEDNDIITYTWTNGASKTNIPTTFANGVKIQNLEVISFGNGQGITINPDNGYKIYDGNVVDNTKLILTIDNDNWKFIRSENYLYTPISIKFDVVTPLGTLEDITLHLTSEIEVEYDYTNWEAVGELKIYQGTKVKLVEARDGGFTSSAVIKVKTSKDVTPVIYQDGSVVDSYTNTSDLDLGDYVLKLSIEGQELPMEYPFSVVPNVVLKLKNDNPITLRVGDTSLSDILDVKKFDIGANYGNSDVLYNDGYLTDGVDVSLIDGISATADDMMGLNVTISGGTITISGGDNVNNLNVDIRDVELSFKSRVYGVRVFNSDGTIAENNIVTVNIEPKYDASLVGSWDKSITALTNIEVGNIFTVKDATGNPKDITLTKIENMTDAGVIFSGSSPFILNAIGQEFKNQTIKFTFTIGGEEYTYTIDNVTLKPYTPAHIEIDAQITGTTFDMAGAYDFDTDGDGDPDIHESVKTIVVKDVAFVGDYQDNIVGQYDIILVYDSSRDPKVQTDCKITFNHFSRDTRDVKITYTIRYDSGTSYDDEITFKLNNAQQVTDNRPTGDSYKVTDRFVIENYDDAKAYLYANILRDDLSRYDVANRPYEPIAVPTNTGSVKLNLITNSLYDMTRVGITTNDNITLTDDFKTNNPIKTELVGYSEGLTTYANSVKALIDGNIITLPTISESATGYLLFKVTTNTGNFAYYMIRVYGARFVNVETCESYSITPNGTDDIKTLIARQQEDWYKVYGLNETDAGRIKFYLVTSTVAGGTQYSNVDTFTAVDNYTTTKLVLIYEGINGEVYSVGSMNLTLCPDITVSHNEDGILYGKGVSSTGIYENIEIKYTSAGIENPFTVSAGATTIGITGAEVITNLEGFESCMSLDDLGKITFSNYTNESISFTVKYTFGNVELRVNYIYLPINLKTGPQAPITVGQWDAGESNFVNTVNIQDIIKGTRETQDYVRGITIKINGTNNEIDAGTLETYGVKYNDGELTFKQTHQDHNIVLAFTYDNYIATEKSAIFTFEVLKNVHVEENLSDDHGLIDTTPVNTDKNPAESAYNSDVGSTLAMAQGSNSYSIAGLKYVYGEGSNYQLKVTASSEDAKYICDSYIEEDKTYGAIYILNASGGARYNKEGVLEYNIAIDRHDLNYYYYDILFYHLAEAKNIVLNVTLQTSGGVDIISRNIYVKISQTYSGLQQITPYQNVADATATAQGIYTTYISSNLQVVGLDGEIVSDANLGSMRFNREGNPNKLVYSLGADSVGYNLLENETKIKFNDVASNTPTKLYISNLAGISSLVYNFQIINNNVDEDYLDYSESTGTHGFNGTAEYVSFVTTKYAYDSSTEYYYIDSNNNGQYDNGETIVAGDGNYLSAKTLGKLIDTKNSTHFTIDSATANGNTVDPEREVLEDGTIKYTITYDGYSVVIQFKDGVISVLENETDITWDTLKLSLKMKGMTGYLTSNEDSDDVLDVYIFNYPIVSKYQYDQDVQPATSTIAISDIVYGVGDDFTYSLDESVKFEYNEASYPITDVVSLSGDNKSLILQSIGCDILILPIKINIIKDNIMVGVATYNVQVNRNIVYVPNLDMNSADTDTTKDYDMITNLQLTAHKNTDVTPNVYVFKEVQIATSDVNSVNAGNCYNGLQLNLYNKVDTTGAGLSNEAKNLGINLVNISIDSLVVNGEAIQSDDIEDYVEYNSFKLTFKKDFNGLLKLKLSRGTYFTDAPYERIWTINVKSILDLKNNSNNDTEIQTDSKTPFTSGEQVALITKDKNQKGNGIEATLSSFTVGGVNLCEFDTLNMTANYVIVDEDDVTSFESAYTNEDETKYSLVSDQNIIDDGEIDYKITLPSVPISQENDRAIYLVIYKVELSYLDSNNTFEYYVAYRVENKHTLTASTEAINFNYVADTTDHYIESLTGEEYLKLFYFEEQLLVDTDEDGKEDAIYTLSYKKNGGVPTKCLNDGEFDYFWNGTVYERGTVSYTVGTDKITRKDTAPDPDTSVDFDIISRFIPREFRYNSNDWLVSYKIDTDDGNKVKKCLNDGTDNYWYESVGYKKDEYTIYQVNEQYTELTKNTDSPEGIKPTTYYIYGDSNANFDRFSSFIESLKDSESIKLNSDNEFTFTHTLIENKYWVINLKQPSDRYLFEKEQEFDISFYSDSGLLHSNKLTLKTDITDNNKKILLSSIFTVNNVTDPTWLNYSINGVITSPTGYDQVGEPGKYVEYIVDGTTYKLYKDTTETSSTNGIYATTFQKYYLYSSTGYVFTVNYQGIGAGDPNVAVITVPSGTTQIIIQNAVNVVSGRDDSLINNQIDLTITGLDTNYLKENPNKEYKLKLSYSDPTTSSVVVDNSGTITMKIKWKVKPAS